MKKKIYAVKSGRKTGIFNEWQKCHEQINKYPNEEFLGFEYRSDLEDDPEDVPGSLRYAIKEAKEFLGDLVYLGDSADCLEDVSWVEDGFLPFGNEPEAENSEVFSDKSEEDEEDIEDFDEEPDEWLIDNRNTLDALMESWEIEYWKIAEDMKKCVELIKYGRSDTERKTAASNLKRHLERCLDDMNLIDLTAIYKGLKENNAIGYNPPAVAKFVGRMANRYPKPMIIETEVVDPAARAHEDPNYHEQAVEEKPFDVMNRHHRTVLMKLMVQMVRGQITPPNGVGLSRFGDEWEMRVDGKIIALYSVQDEDDEDGYYCTLIRDYKLVSDLVNGTPGLLDLVVQKITADGY